MSEKITVADIYDIKEAGRRFSCVTCYDYTLARIVAQTDIEMVMVGDSAGQVVLGHSSTLPVGMDFMVAITAAVRRATPNALLVADMPFLSYQVSIAQAVENAGRFFMEAMADVIKIEASREQIGVVKAVSDAGMSVMTHIGIRPQTIAKTGRLKAEGTTLEQALELVALADDMIEAGANLLLLEGTAREVAQVITKRSTVPVLSCGSGPDCDGQVLVLSDVLGLNENSGPKFAKKYASILNNIKQALDDYSQEVHKQAFPDDAHSYHMRASELDKFREMFEL